jgi:hypothetical protein
MLPPQSSNQSPELEPGYDAAQERGEVASGRDGPGAGVSNGNAKATVADVGITRKEIHDARLVRDAEVADPGIVRRTVEKDLAAGKEPTKAKLRPCPGECGQAREVGAEKEDRTQEGLPTSAERDPV